MENYCYYINEFFLLLMFVYSIALIYYSGVNLILFMFYHLSVEEKSINTTFTTDVIIQTVDDILL